MKQLENALAYIEKAKTALNDLDSLLPGFDFGDLPMRIHGARMDLSSAGRRLESIKDDLPKDGAHLDPTDEDYLLRRCKLLGVQRKYLSDSLHIAPGVARGFLEGRSILPPATQARLLALLDLMEVPLEQEPPDDEDD